MRIQNPVIPGFHPDPSVIRVGQDYYLVTSSFEYFPGVPIYHSRDLVNWTQIGHVLTRKSQLNLDGLPPSAGVYAATIRYNAGLFYMVTTNVRSGGNFFVTAADPAGSWSEPIWIDPQVIDPSFFFDEDGVVYYTRRGEKGIVQAEIDLASGQLKTPLRMVVEKFICSDIEGPHLYKINGWYYLMAAEGGTRYGHCEVIGRSRSPWGPFEPCPHNPILTMRDQAHTFVRDTGHAELVEDPQGNWWIFCLGTRNLEYLPASILGRETFLAPVRWQEGWPVVGLPDAPGQIPDHFESSLLPEQHSFLKAQRDDFDTTRLDFAWNFLRNPNPADGSLHARPGFLRLQGSAVGLDDYASPAFLGRRQEQFAITARCMLEFEPHADNEEAGLSVFLTSRHHYDLAVTLRRGQRCSVLKKAVGDLQVESQPLALAPGPVELQIACDGKTYTFSVRQGEGQNQVVGTGLARLVSPEAVTINPYGTWTGVYLALYATGNGKPCAEPSDFDWFAYTENPA
jgi:alpha-N-arabinofuranosidase